MAHRTFSLRIEESCSQDWESMSKEGKGRYCGHCTKVVVDFTTMSEAQIKAYFQNYSGEVCGRFETHQLKTNYSYTSKRPWYTSRFLQYAISGLLTFKSLEGIAHGAAVQTEQTYDDTAKNAAPLSVPDSKDTIKVEGKILSTGGSGIPNASISISETGQTFTTNSNGKFKLELPADFKGTEILVNVSAPHYLPASVRIDLTSKEPLKIQLVQKRNVKMGKVMYTPDTK